MSPPGYSHRCEPQGAAHFRRSGDISINTPRSAFGPGANGPFIVVLFKAGAKGYVTGTLAANLDFVNDAEAYLPVIVAVFQWGGSLLGVSEKVREAWDRTGDNHASVAGGLAATARVITLLVVPATMFLLGKANWWTPRWLRRFPELLEPVETPKTAAITTPASAGAVHDPPAVRHGRRINATLNDVHRSHAGTLLDALDTRRHGGVPQSLSRR